MSQVLNSGILFDDDTTADVTGGYTEPREVSNNIDQGQLTGNVQQSAPEVNAQNQQKQQNVQQAPDTSYLFMSELQAADADVTLSPEGEKYLTDLKKALNDEGFEVTRLVDTGMHLVYSKAGSNIGIGLFFSECAPRQNRMFMPITKSLSRYYADVSKHAKNVNCIDIIMITPQDYICVKQMASRLVSSIRFLMTDSASIANMSKFQFRLVTNQNATMSRIKQLSPHGVLPYMQYAVSLEVATEDRNTQTFNGFRHQDEIDWRPVFTLGGYTEFIYDRDARSDYPPFIPVVTISECAIRYSPITMLPMIIYAAYDGFIRSGLYLDPFKNVGERGANIGELVMHNNVSCRINDSYEMDTFINKYVGKPLLAVDITEGRINYHGFNLMCHQDSTKFLSDCIIRSTGGNINAANNFPESFVKGRSEMYTGVVNLNGDLVDTRSIDYFTVVNSKNDEQLVRRFLNYNSRPEDRMQAIYDAGYGASVGSNSGLTSYYSTYKYLLDEKAMAAFFNIASQLNLIMAGSANYTPAFNFSMLRKSAEALYNTDIHCGMNSNANYHGVNSFRGANANVWRSAHDSYFSR